jgi:hypothetical protein
MLIYDCPSFDSAVAVFNGMDSYFMGKEFRQDLQDKQDLSLFGSLSGRK